MYQKKSREEVHKSMSAKAKKQYRNRKGFCKREDQNTPFYSVATSPNKKGDLSKNAIEYFRMLRKRLRIS